MALLLISDGRIRSLKLDQPEGQRHDDFRLDHSQLLPDAVPRATLEGPPRGAGDGREAWREGVVRKESLRDEFRGAWEEIVSAVDGVGDGPDHEAICGEGVFAGTGVGEGHAIRRSVISCLERPEWEDQKLTLHFPGGRCLLV